MKPWVTKKIMEYLGEEESTLINYICKKLLEHATPENTEAALLLVLEEEASDFMIRMWRMLIYNVLVARGS
jgi:RNA-binding protein 25